MSDPHLGRGWSGAQTRGVAPKVCVVGAQNTTGGVCPLCETTKSPTKRPRIVCFSPAKFLQCDPHRCPSAATISLLLVQYTCKPAVLVVTLTCQPLPLMATRFMRRGSLANLRCSHGPKTRKKTAPCRFWTLKIGSLRRSTSSKRKLHTVVHEESCVFTIRTLKYRIEFVQH